MVVFVFKPPERSSLWLDRCCDVIRRFCSETPPHELVLGWVTDPEDSRLQDWVNERLQPGAHWAQGIEIIDAAIRLADTPAEGAAYEHLGPTA